MFANALARSLASRDIHYGWVMVTLTLCFVICSSAVMSIPGILLIPLSKEFGWSIGELSGPLGLRMALFGMVAPFAGALMLRYGPRNVVSASAALLIVGIVLAMTTRTKWQLWLSFGTILGIAPGMTALVLPTTIATRWFTERRGLVLGLMGAGTATGQLIFLTPAAWLTEHYGWRMALAPSAVMVGLVALAFYLLACDRPSDVELPPYGEDAVLTTPADPSGQCSRAQHCCPSHRGFECRLLGSGLHVLCLRRVQLRIDAAFRNFMRRLRDCAADRYQPPGVDRDLRHDRHHRIRMVVRPVRQSMAAGGLLRVQGPVAHLASLQRLLDFRSHDVRGLLRPGFHCDHSADRSTRGASFRARTGSSGVRMDIRRASTWRRNNGRGRWSNARRVLKLFAGVLCGWSDLRARGAVHAAASGTDLDNLDATTRLDGRHFPDRFRGGLRLSAQYWAASIIARTRSGSGLS